MISHLRTFQKGLLAAFLLLGLGHAQITLPNPPSAPETLLQPATDAEQCVWLSFDCSQEARGVPSQSKPNFIKTEADDIYAKTPDAGSRWQCRGVFASTGSAKVRIRNRGPPNMAVTHLL